MKKTSLLILLFFLSISLFAQQNKSSFRIGIKAGLSTSDIDVNALNILDEGGTDRLSLAVKDAKYGLHAGIVLRAQINKFLIQPEILFNSNTVDYTVEDFDNSDMVNNVLSEKYQYLDIPVLLGFKFGPLRLQGGPVGHIFLDSSSDFFDLNDINYRQEFENMTIGWQAGLGLDIWSVMIDLRFEGNFTNFGNHLNFAGQQYEFDDSPTRFVASVGYLF